MGNHDSLFVFNSKVEPYFDIFRVYTSINIMKNIFNSFDKKIKEKYQKQVSDGHETPLNGEYVPGYDTARIT